MVENILKHYKRSLRFDHGLKLKFVFILAEMCTNHGRRRISRSTKSKTKPKKIVPLLLLVSIYLEILSTRFEMERCFAHSKYQILKLRNIIVIVQQNFMKLFKLCAFFNENNY